MSSSKSRSPSAEIVPPTTSLARDPLPLINSVFESQGNGQKEGDVDADADADADLEEEQAPQESLKALTAVCISSLLPFNN